MTGPLFDNDVLSIRRARAARIGGGAFLAERAFDDVLDRIGAVRRSFASAVIYGHAEPSWPDRLRAAGIGDVAVIEPGSATPLPDAADLCISIGVLDTAEPLPAVLAAIRHALAPGALFIGALAGGDSLPALRSAMRAADLAEGGAAAAHVHPRIDPPSFAALLADAGFAMPVVDVDRVRLRYADFGGLVRDLRAMGATNRLHARPRTPILRHGLAAAQKAFATLASDGKTTETLEILHFAGWTPEAIRQPY